MEDKLVLNFILNCLENRDSMFLFTEALKRTCADQIRLKFPDKRMVSKDIFDWEVKIAKVETEEYVSSTAGYLSLKDPLSLFLTGIYDVIYVLNNLDEWGECTYPSVYMEQRADMLSWQYWLYVKYK